ncbi:hypothetical protein EKH57_13505 [Halorubrum sp. BOL3-1]|uniref:hypothetical protein n=1 Tax=Halorubrum sp. BOL3-1 TaxID=2497325 RepID=UPI0010050933|nr:hypothetical protein [Halorubrum sp. BOL3-1]QAU13652.1 hypothetical protein EKH57_13505 [Halorubrum sp. BOL3-1]
MSIGDVVSRFRQPEYTGGQRCVPCTVVNSAIGVVAAAVIGGAVGTSAGVVVGTGVGAIVFGLSAASIALRGYLVPGTPTLTKRYFPDWLLRRFDKGPQTRAEVSPDEDLDVETVLMRAEAVKPCENADDLCLTEEFRTAWNDRLDFVRSEEASRAELAEILGIEADSLSFEEFGEAFVAYVDETRVGQWESRGAFLADVAAATELEARLDGWETLGLRQQSQLLYALRLFLEECPTCTGAVAIEEDTVESCCRSIDIVAVSCQECGARIFETDHPGDVARAT